MDSHLWFLVLRGSGMRDDGSAFARVSTSLLALVLCCLPFAGHQMASAQGRSASIQDVSQGFADAVHLYCIRSVLQGVPVDALEPINGLRSISPASANRPTLGSGQVWAVDGLGEIVVLTASEDLSSCRVNAYGPPVSPLFDALAGIVVMDQYGFTETASSVPAERLRYRRTFVREDDGVRYTLTLSGNEPGARGTRSRFSTLSATVAKHSAEAE
jgi:hypothetical protein